MAPNFLSKLVKAASPSHNRDRSDRSLDSPRSSESTPSSRGRAASSPEQESSSPSLARSRSKTSKFDSKQVPSIVVPHSNNSSTSVDTSSTQPNVTVVPPSPLVQNGSLSSSSSNPDLKSFAQESGTNGQHTFARGRTISTVDDDDIPTPTTAKPPVKHSATTVRPTTPANTNKEATMPRSNTTLEPAQEIRRKASNKSIASNKSNKSAKLPPISTMPTSETMREAIESTNGTATPKPIVESPTALTSPEFPSSEQVLAKSMTSPGAMLSPRDNTDAVSFISTNTTNGKEKKRPWRRSTTRKPTGLASAIAASGLAMANTSISAAHQAQINPTLMTSQMSNGSTNSKPLPGSPPYMRSPRGSTNHVKSRSTDMSPRSTKSRGSAKSSRRRTSVSVHSDGTSEMHVDDRPGYYSGLEEGSSGDEDSESSDDLMDLDLGEDDIPVTGFAVASNKRNADFHELFPTIPEGDYLIEDYGCALQREILIQGRIYISENHICFHANIFGWITDLSVPIYDITSLERKMTAYVIPNAIQITTRQNKYTFASFLSRDTTFDVIYNIWRLARPTDTGSIASGRGSLDVPMVPGTEPQTIDGALVPAAAIIRKATQCTCGKEGQHFSETALDVVIPGTPERIHNLIFASGFMKDFMAVNQKLFDIQMADWSPAAPGSNLLTRNMSYIKPLGGSLGPKQTKCEIRDEMAFCDYDKYISTVTTTRTPDVPSGSVFSVKTRTCIMWASPASSRIVVSTEIVWSGRSFIKAIIERSAIEGQKVYHMDLEKAMRAYIHAHQSEFIPEGMDPAALVVVAAPPGSDEKFSGEATPKETVTEEERKRREKERNQRGLQWAWDTFDGAAQVAKQSTMGALELIKDAWDQSTSTTILIFLIVILVLSNVWTLIRMGSREEAGRRKELRKAEEREKWVQSVVTALWDEMAAGKREFALAAGQMPAFSPQPADGLHTPGNWKTELEYLRQTLDSVDDRVKAIRESLSSFEGNLNALD